MLVLKTMENHSKMAKAKTSILLFFSGLGLSACTVVEQNSYHEQRQYLAQVSHLLEQYKALNGTYPSTTLGINGLTLPNHDGEVISANIRYFDQWQQAIVYRYPGMCGEGFDLYSKGPDKVDNCGEKDDISSN